MHTIRYLVLAAVGAAVMGLAAAEEEADKEPAPVTAAIITGGHGFDKEALGGFLEALDGVECTLLDQKDHSEFLEDIEDWPYDVIVFYNMSKKASPKRRANFEALMEKGVGLVALHHTMAAFPDWPEFHEAIGTDYLLADREIDGKKHPKSGFKHDLDLVIKIADPDHPVTRGVGDFETHDETYIRCLHAPDNHVLLTCDDPTSDKDVGWVREYKNARVCCIQPGHGPSIFGQAPYRQLVRQAIFWAAKRDLPAAGDAAR